MEKDTELADLATDVGAATAISLRDDLPRYFELARACKATYAGPIRHEYLRYKGARFDEQDIVHGSVARGFCRIFSNNLHVVVAFRGTRESVDWKIANLKFAPVPLRGSSDILPPLVHRGFQGALYSIDKTTKKPAIEAITDHLRRLNREMPGRCLIVTGHSLGGAIAILTAAKLAALRPELGMPIDEVVTFGGPAVGLNGFGRLIRRQKLNITRIVNAHDIIPCTPPVAYSHVGRGIWLSDDGIVSDPGWLRRLTSLRSHPSAFVQDHAIGSYITRLKLAQAAL